MCRSDHGRGRHECAPQHPPGNTDPPWILWTESDEVNEAQISQTKNMFTHLVNHSHGQNHTWYSVAVENFPIRGLLMVIV